MNIQKLSQGKKIMWGGFIGEIIFAIISRGDGPLGILIFLSWLATFYGAYLILKEKQRSYAWLLLVFFFNLIGIIVVHFLGEKSDLPVAPSPTTPADPLTPATTPSTQNHPLA